MCSSFVQPSHFVEWGKVWSCIGTAGDFGTVRHFQSRFIDGYAAAQVSNTCGGMHMRSNCTRFSFRRIRGQNGNGIVHTQLICACWHSFRRWNSIFHFGIDLDEGRITLFFIVIFSPHIMESGRHFDTHKAIFKPAIILPPTSSLKHQATRRSG